MRVLARIIATEKLVRESSSSIADRDDRTFHGR
jgi:hypothetical protein